MYDIFPYLLRFRCHAFCCFRKAFVPAVPRLVYDHVQRHPPVLLLYMLRLYGLPCFSQRLTAAVWHFN